MENIYKIKIRTNPDPTGLYPSERRYSASTVLGLSVVHIALAITALLMATLTLSGYQVRGGDHLHNDTSTIANVSMAVHPYLSVAPCVMSVGALAAGLTGLLAWKRWYIDRNIRWFFFTALLSTLTATTSVFITTVTIASMYEAYRETVKDDELPRNNGILQLDYAHVPNIKFILSLNILITCVLELIWSCLSSKVAFAGMMNTYPEDIIISKGRGKIEVNTVHKGNKRSPHGTLVPPDLLNHFPNGNKIAKYLPKIEAPGNLAKAESSSEYQERVRKFLSGNNQSSPQQLAETDKSDNGSEVEAGDRIEKV